MIVKRKGWKVIFLFLFLFCLLMPRIASAQSLDVSSAWMEQLSPTAMRIRNILVDGTQAFWAEFNLQLDPQKLQLVWQFNNVFGTEEFSVPAIINRMDGMESCRVCHGSGHDFAVDKVHDISTAGVNFQIVGIDKQNYQVGDKPSVTFTVKDDAGNNIALKSLTAVNAIMAGPTSNYAFIMLPDDNKYPAENIRDKVVDNGNGTYTYTFELPIPDTYPPPFNDSDAFGPGDGELKGASLIPGTYTISVWGYKDTGKAIPARDAGEDTVDVLVGGAATLEPREVVKTANCNECHSDLQIHGGTRRATELCILCHTAGAEDGISKDPAKQTPGVTIEYKVMIHKIHMGANLHQVKDKKKPYQIIGFRESLHDFSHVEFPMMPEGVKNCTKCHKDAAQGDNYKNNPSRAVCGACHDEVNFATGEKHPGGPQADDSACKACHPGDGPGLAPVASAHLPALLDPNLAKGVVVAISKVEGASRADGTFQVGDKPKITFTVKDKAGADIPLNQLLLLRLHMAGPTSNYQRVPKDEEVLVSVVQNQVQVDPTIGHNPDGSHTWEFKQPLPATYPEPHNDSTTFNWTFGELQGVPLQPGTYTIGLYGSKEVKKGETVFRDAGSTTEDVLLLGALLKSPREVVKVDNCNQCHGDLALHGGSRKDTKLCVICHTSGAEDRIPADKDPAKQTLDVTIDFRVMIHKIHRGADLGSVQEGKLYKIIGFRDTVLDFSEVEFPAMPGGVINCFKCHGKGSPNVETPPAQGDNFKNPSRKVCTSCHDGENPKSHANTMTNFLKHTGD